MGAFWPLALLVLVVVLIVGRKRKDRAPAGPDWRILYSPGMPGRPTSQGAGWYFDFPTNPASHVHYVPWFNPPSLAGKSHIVTRFSITGGGFVPQEYPDGRPALVSLLIQRKGDDWTAAGPMAAYRWYSKQSVTLAEGEFELSVPLDVSTWGDVYGGQDSTAFTTTLRDVDNIALVFGSDGGRGHGVYATDGGRFTLLGIEVR